MCLDSAVRVYDKPLREKRIGYKIKSCREYNSKDYKYQNSRSAGEIEADNKGKEYEPGFHILTSRKTAAKLTRILNKQLEQYSWADLYCVFKVEYNDIVAEGYETCDNIVDCTSGRCRCDVARRMKVLEKIEVR